MEDYWYKNIIIYSIDVKSYCDSNGDGIGDFKGLSSKLDYIRDLGINCIWLLPFYPSPLKDNGYDVKDYYDVDQRLGTISDFQEFIRGASERGINVIIDLVMNHTSDEHPWFKAARNDSNSIFRDYYVWSKIIPPIKLMDRPAFPNAEHGVWHFDEVANSYYYHKFYRFQPDLHVSNPRVRHEILKVIDFWLSLGVAGFRIDAVPIMINQKGLEKTKPLNAHEIVTEIRRFVSSRRKGAVIFGEVDVEGEKLIDYFSEGEGLHLLLNFLLNAHIVCSIAEEKVSTLVRGWRELPVIPNSGSWVNFLRNLDEFNLQQLPEKDRDLVFELLGKEKEMQIYERGIRRRIASMLDGNQKRIEMAYSLLFSLPGTPMINYGDEIGMGENLDLWERESVRTPMQWSSETGAGFSNVSENRFYRALVKDKNFHHSNVSVVKQMSDQGSLLNKIKKIIYARKMHTEIGFGQISWITTNHKSVLGHICHWKNDMLLAVHNLSGESLQVVLNLKTVYAKRLELRLGDSELLTNENGILTLDMKPYGYVWFSVYYERGEDYE